VVQEDEDQALNETTSSGTATSAQIDAQVARACGANRQSGIFTNVSWPLGVAPQQRLFDKVAQPTGGHFLMIRSISFPRVDW
jgi:hypothetical protein